MKVKHEFNTKRIQKHYPLDLPPGTVYTWGAKVISYMRVAEGSLCLAGTYELIPEGHTHFRKDDAPWVVVADATLTATYEN